MKIHKSVTLERVADAIEDAETTLGNPGFCIACGAEAHDVEPDARQYLCESCGLMQVYGAEELLFLLNPIA